MKKEKFTWENLIGLLFIIGAFFLLCLVMMQGISDDIWYDEVFSMGMAGRSFKDIISITASDVHPPLYYFYLKIVHDIGGVIVPFVSEIVICKMASVLPVVVILIIAVTKLVKRFGILCIGCFSFLIMSMPQLNTYMLEIRMYSLASLLITLLFLKAYDIVIKEKKGFADFLLLFIYGILTAYTQYFACVAVIAVYISLLVFFLITKCEKRYLRNWIICVGCSVVAYIPWLPILFSQFNKVNTNYWIQPMGIRSLFGCIKFIFLPVSFDVKMNYVAAIIMITVTFFVFIMFLKSKPDKKELFFVFTGWGTVVFVVLVGFVLSIVNTPIFVYRYMVPALFVFWLVEAYLLTGIMNKKWYLILLIPFLLGGFLSTKGFYQEEHKKIVQMEETSKVLNEIPVDAVIVTNFDHVTAISAYYLKNDVYLYEGVTDPLISDMFSNCKQSCNEEMMLKKLQNGKKVYFFGSFNAREELIEEWKQQGITANEINSCLLERYWFNIYELGVENQQ